MMFAQLRQPTRACILALVLGIVPTAAAWAKLSCNQPEIEKQFTRQFQEINRNIHLRQEILEQKINDPMASEAEIKEMTRDLIRWKAKRDTLAIDYILKIKRDCPTNPDLSPIRNK